MIKLFNNFCTGPSFLCFVLKYPQLYTYLQKLAQLPALPFIMLTFSLKIKLSFNVKNICVVISLILKILCPSVYLWNPFR